MSSLIHTLVALSWYNLLLFSVDTINNYGGGYLDWAGVIVASAVGGAQLLRLINEALGIIRR
jgi:hypothetical protein